MKKWISLIEIAASGTKFERSYYLINDYYTGPDGKPLPKRLIGLNRVTNGVTAIDRQ